MQKLDSLTIFFPFLNDEGTVERQITMAYEIGKKVAKDFEVIAIHGGASVDNTMGRILEMKQKYPSLIVLDKFDNKEGYAVIKYGLAKASKKWIFYTDGDAQYHLEKDLPRLIESQFKTMADVVNGYKKRRRDSLWRVLLGSIYARFSRLLLDLPISDIDCDFRLIRRDFLKRITLQSTDSTILPELIKKLALQKALFAEVSVSHYPRIWGNSNYNILDLIKEKIVGDVSFFLELRRYK